MGKGGARPHSGPAPDPNALRRDRPSDAAGWITLPAEGRTDPAPAWPLAIAPSPAEEAHWTREWARPQAIVWEAQGQEVEVALYVRCLAEAEIPGAAANLRGEVRQRAEHLGLSLPGLARNHWRIAPSTTAPAATATASPSAARPARRGPSSRDRFRVVKPTDEE